MTEQATLANVDQMPLSRREQALAELVDFPPYRPRSAVAVVDPKTSEVVIDISPEMLTKLAELASLGFTDKHCFEGVGIAGAIDRMRSLASLPKDPSGAGGALREVSRAVEYGRLQWREFIGKTMRTRIALDQAPTAATLAAKQPHGLGWVDRQEVVQDAAVKVEVVHRIIGNDGTELEIDKASAQDIEATPIAAPRVAAGGDGDKGSPHADRNAIRDGERSAESNPSPSGQGAGRVGQTSGEQLK